MWKALFSRSLLKGFNSRSLKIAMSEDLNSQSLKIKTSEGPYSESLHMKTWECPYYENLRIATSKALKFGILKIMMRNSAREAKDKGKGKDKVFSKELKNLKNDIDEIGKRLKQKISEVDKSS
ncbi:hypothetical protein OWV82_018932 [Melia azedarach]|uniref:Uncharacterized protein n=1 Tax=Melia azedarach TaxID=155640 RepID=A0ACC1XD33_MELAZ|nr:hypothetical protein OWV82_018932 [Melia azedarach]